MPAQARWWYFSVLDGSHQLPSDSDRGTHRWHRHRSAGVSAGVQTQGAGIPLIIVGIAISAVLAAVNTWLILKADLEDAMSAAVGGGNTQQQKSGCTRRC